MAKVRNHRFKARNSPHLPKVGVAKHKVGGAKLEVGGPPNVQETPPVPVTRSGRMRWTAEECFDRAAAQVRVPLPKLVECWVTHLNPRMTMMIGVLGRVDFNGHFAPITTKW